MLGLFTLATAFQTANGQTTTSDASFASHLNPTTAVVIRIDTGGLELSESLLKAAANNQAMKEMLVGLDADLKWLAENLEGKPFFVLIDVPYSSSQPPVRILLPKVDQERQAELDDRLESMHLTKPIFKGQFGVVTLNDKRYSAASSFEIESLTLPVPSEQFSTAISAVEGFPVQIAIVPPDYLVRTYKQLMINLPSELGGGPIDRVTEGMKWAAIGLNPKSVETSVVIQSESAAAAEQLANFLPDLTTNLIGFFGDKRTVDLQVAKIALAPLMKQTVEDDRILINLSSGDNAALAATSIASVADLLLSPLLRRDVTNKLKQIGLAIHNYESSYGSLPPAKKMRGVDGKSGLSWRVHILPFIGEIELYNKFKLDQPWDSETNKQLLSLMPDLYKIGEFSLSNPRSEVPAGYTTLVAPVGEGTIFGGDDVNTISRVTDGLSNTAMVVEVKPELAVPWTSPDDYAFDPKSPATGLLDKDDKGYFVLLGDGAVVRLPASTPDETILHLFQMNDGNPVNY